MDVNVVTEAVRQLRADNQKVTARAVQAITRGSMRDVHKLLRDVREFLEDDEIAALDTEAVEPLRPPSLGRIRETIRSAEAADRAAGEASTVLNETRDRLRDLVAHPPPPAIDPEDVSASVEARLEHEAMVYRLQKEVDQLQRLSETHMAEARAFRAELNALRRKAYELREVVIPGYTRDLADARDQLASRERDLMHALDLAKRHVAGRERALSAAEQELEELVRG